MSIEAMTSCWWEGFPANADGISAPVVRLVALAIADTVNDAYDNRFWGKLRNIADKIGVTRDTVRRVMAYLVEAEVVELLHEVPGAPSVYRWILQPTSRQNREVTPRQNREAPRGETATPRGADREGVAAPAATINPTDTQDDPKGNASVPATTDRRTELFNAFWTAYPRKIGKPVAFRSFNAALRRSSSLSIEQTAGRIMAGLDRWAPYWKARNEPEFIPHPSTWLNQDRYHDDPPAYSSRGARPTGRNAGTFGDQDLHWAADEMQPGGLLAEAPLLGLGRGRDDRRTD